MRGILFDLAHVTAGATTLLQSGGVADRCQIVSGDFFASVPEGGDAYVMKHIIHDWDDERVSLTFWGGACNAGIGYCGSGRGVRLL